VTDLSRAELESPARGVVHVWLIDLRRAESEAHSSGEKTRLESERDVRVEWRIRAGRRSREILARYLGCSPELVPIERGEHGKPSLGAGERADLSYSLSHSGDFALMAVSKGRRVGVDLERVRPTARGGALAARFFSPQEADAIGVLSDRVRLEAFFRTWVRNEAYIKGLGGSVPSGLRRCEIVVDRAGIPQILSSRLEPTETSRWSIRDLEAPPGYVAALATEGDVERIVPLQGQTARPSGTTQVSFTSQASAPHRRDWCTSPEPSRSSKTFRSRPRSRTLAHFMLPLS